MNQPNTKGVKAEEWVKDFAQQYRILNTIPLSLEKVVLLLENQLQYKLALARPHVRKEFGLANEWINSIISGRRVSGNIEEKGKLASKLLDLCVATDTMLRLKDNKGNEHLIAVDVASNPNSEPEKLDIIRGKRDTKDSPGFNRNQNIGQVRQALGITKHLILVINPDNPPAREQLLNTIYAFANQAAKTGSINLYSQPPQVALSNQVSSPPQSADQVQLDPNLTKVLSLIERLPEKELANTVQRVQNYLANMPPLPPTQAERLAVQQEIKELLPQIQSLWQRQERQVQIVESMQKNPLRAWDHKYDAAMAELQRTMKLIKEAITQKDQKESQLKDWGQQEKVYKAWLNDPQTKQMHQVAAVLKIPQIQERVHQMRHKEQQRQQQTLSKLEPKQQRARPNLEQGRGLTL